VRIARGARTVLDADRFTLRALWSDTSHRIAKLRDDANCADDEHALRLDPVNPGLTAHVSFDAGRDISAPYLNLGARPRIAIFREQGVNGHVEMAASFDRVGFEAVDVHASDILEGRVQLASFRGLAACGGFSYGDVLGAGQGWAKSILFHDRAREEFQQFFARSDTFTLGVCNGCQMLANLRELIPGAQHWAAFRRNRSEQFEARVGLVRVEESPSIFFRGMAGSRLPVAVAHGEGRAVFANEASESAVLAQKLVAARFVDGEGNPTERYPLNPNGSREGLTSLTTPDGRATILMPHPERVIRTAQLSWHPREWGHDSPWLRFFANARHWVS
jgi:phosphoribosylformylglycinamidine synthase